MAAGTVSAPVCSEKRFQVPGVDPNHIFVNIPTTHTKANRTSLYIVSHCKSTERKDYLWGRNELEL